MDLISFFLYLFLLLLSVKRYPAAAFRVGIFCMHFSNECTKTLVLRSVKCNRTLNSDSSCTLRLVFGLIGRVGLGTESFRCILVESC